MQESWLPVVGYEGRFEISDLGRCRSYFASYNRRRIEPLILTPRILTGGYPGYTLNKGVPGSRKQLTAHTLILTAFVGPKPQGKLAAHADGNSGNSVLSNLRWATPKENSADDLINGARVMGEKNNKAKLTAPIVLEIRKLPKGFNVSHVAIKFGVSRMAIRCAYDKRTWKHV